MNSTEENILKRTRNTNIDLLKLCASIGVIGLHTFKYDAAPILYYLCCFSVPVFFMVSAGFGIFCPQKPGLGRSPNKHFAVPGLEIISEHGCASFTYYLWNSTILRILRCSAEFKIFRSKTFETKLERLTPSL